MNFNNNWTDYEKGFGDLNTKFWYGLESMHCLTQRGQWEMRVDYQFRNGSRSYLHYKQFRVESAIAKYRLTVGGFTGVGQDKFNYHNKAYFSTPDNDNDNTGCNCADINESGWWFKSCNTINLNTHSPHNSIFSEMKIHPKDCIIQ